MQSLPDLPDRIGEWLAEAAGRDFRPRRYLVAYSGGLDSTVLLHLLKAQLPTSVELAALHINHGMQADSDDWDAHCRRFCTGLVIQYYSLKVQVGEIDRHGPEAAARLARYTAFDGFIQTGDVLLLAQHQWDQAETVLLQLMRGSGVRGLAAMPRIVARSGGWLLRPFLDISRDAIKTYALAHELSWIEDPSNQDRHLDRGYMRHQIVPQLDKRWPGVQQQIARSAKHLAETSELLEILAVQDLQPCQIDTQRLSIAGLSALTDARCRNVLRYWIHQQTGSAPSTAVLARIEQDLLKARCDAEPKINIDGYLLRRYRDGLYLLPCCPPAPRGVELEWDLQAELALPAGCGRLRALVTEGTTRGLPQAYFKVRFPSGGERIQPSGARHHRRLKLLLQESAVPPWVRRRMPLIYHGQQLVAVADRWISADLPQGVEFTLQWLDAPAGWNSQE